MKLLAALISLSFCTPSFANDFAKIVCEPLATVESVINGIYDPQEASALLSYRSKIQTFMQNSEASLEQNLGTNSTAAVAITCGMVDDATLNFTKPCFDDSGVEMNLKSVEKMCKDIASK